MRPFRTAVLIIGLFHPLVIQAQPFGDSEVFAYDTDFLNAPASPDPVLPEEPAVPDWIALLPEPEPDVPAIFDPELPS